MHLQQIPAHPPMIQLRFFRCTLILWLTLPLVVLDGAQAQDRPARVKVDTVVKEPLRQTVPILGRIVAKEQGAVAAGVPGPLRKVHVQVGDKVKVGELLAELVTDMREAMIARSAADLTIHEARKNAAKAQLLIAKDEMQRLEKLKNSSAFPRARYEDQQHEVVRFTSQLAEASAAFTRTDAQLRAARIDLARTQIRAPYDAVVTRKHVSAGAYLRLGDAIVTLMAANDLEVEADVPSERLGGVIPGVKMDAVFDNGESIQVTVRALIPDENPLTRTRPVRFSANLDPKAAIAANQSITVAIPAGEPRQVVSVHKDAIINRKGQQLVYVVADGKANIRLVQLGEAVGPRLEVLDGLAPGEVVVVRGNERLRPGQAVEPGKT
ncbi:MAG: efflux RND transporter periplasmic adaptor subunit [Gammaproteobacteria bacterium]|nr:efflux RND transporter periplasmic adaptor subunit [Gammaproteobacteria bacterium]